MLRQKITIFALSAKAHLKTKIEKHILYIIKF